MPAKPVFTEEQHRILHETAQRIWRAKFKGMRKSAEYPGGQEAMALALGVTQQSVSNLLGGTYRPGVKVARALANLDGQTLEQLIGDFADPLDAVEHEAKGFTNLTTCIKFYASSKHWSPWTIAAAKAGFFGNADFAPPEWAGKLDTLEKAMERARKSP